MTIEEAIHFATCLKNNWTINFADMEEFCDMAIEALSADVEIVRCGECKYWYEWENGVGSCHISDNPYNWRGTDFTDYCSFGEREEE